MSNNYKMQKYEAICFILIVMVNKLVLNVPYYMIDLVGTGSVINLIYIGIIGLIFVLCLNYLFQRFPNSDIIDISEFLGGKFFKIIMGIIFTIFFLLVSYITLSDFANMIKTIYFQNSPLIFVLLFFMIGIVIANLVGFKSIVRIVCLVVPFTLLSIIVALLGVYNDFSFDKFSPFFRLQFSNHFYQWLTKHLFTLHYNVLLLFNATFKR